MTPTQKFHNRCKIDQWKAIPSLVTLLPLVSELLANNHTGGQNDSHTPGRRLKESVLKAQSSSASCIAILGDLNSGNIFLRDSRVSHSGISSFDRLLFDTYKEVGMHQIIHEPTRISLGCSNLRDQIVLSDGQRIMNSGTLSPFSAIDHMPVYVRHPRYRNHTCKQLYCARSMGLC